ncbi:MAG: dTMP kinase [Thermodesulfobacteriota bacterium]
MTSGRGMLIAFEGIDGTGKSTQVRLAAEALSRRGLAVTTTREPTDGQYGQRIRQLYKNRNSVTPEEELALFVADRREHVQTLIAPALAAGRLVLTDRYYLSTAAYQGAAGQDPARIIVENEAFAPRPDLVILLTIPVALGVHRVRHLRGEVLNDFEQEEALARVAAIFASLTGANIERIDGAGSTEAVHALVMARIDQLLAAG